MQRLSNNKWEDWKDEHLDLIDEEDKHMIFVAERDPFDWLRILTLLNKNSSIQYDSSSNGKRIETAMNHNNSEHIV